MARHGARAQRDLFAATAPPGRLPPEARRALVALLETLPREAAAGETTDREGRDEQDHG
jgi:hypothetical protein